MVCAFLTRDQGRTFKIGLVTLKGHSMWLSPTLSDLLTTINVSEPNRSVTTLHAVSRGKCSLFITDTEDIRPGAAVHVRLGELSLISSDSTLPTFRGCTLSHVLRQPYRTCYLLFYMLCFLISVPFCKS